ncbi:MAG: hypothetical protein M5F18_01725 [Asgard group archaeon]|nr:hypothetical protein [Asgard group archaeon]
MITYFSHTTVDEFKNSTVNKSPLDSSVGRALDCNGSQLVANQPTLPSNGRVFDSPSGEFLFFI